MPVANLASEFTQAAYGRRLPPASGLSEQAERSSRKHPLERI